MVTLDLNDSGTEKFYEATSELYQSKGQISIWMDNTMVSAPSVNAVISDGKASISGNFTYESAKELADKINSGALPFSLETTSFKTISPTMGEGALTAVYFTKSTLLEGKIQDLLGVFNMAGHMDNFVNGILDISGVVYYLSVIAICTFLAMQSLQKKRWN